MKETLETVSVVICAYNEENTIGLVLEKIKSLDYITEVVVVDNGSKDKTGEIIDSFQKIDSRIKKVKVEKNIGLGYGFRQGINQTTGDIVIRQDADLEYDPDEMISLVEQIKNGHADVVYGSRMLVRKAHKVHYFFNFLANIILTFISNLFTNLYLSDVETASKAFKGDIIRSLKLVTNGFNIENEITIKLKANKCIFYEVPISYYGRSYDEGKKIKPIDGVIAVFSILYYWFLCSVLGLCKVKKVEKK